MPRDELRNLLNLKSDGDLGALVRRAREMEELTGALCRGLGDDFAGAVVAANLRADGELVVIAASSAWASRLRYETDVLLEAARGAGLEPTACRVRVTQS
jgi:hypothetical protein